jgi:hypothetical protein
VDWKQATTEDEQPPPATNAPNWKQWLKGRTVWYAVITASLGMLFLILVILAIMLGGRR